MPKFDRKADIIALAQKGLATSRIADALRLSTEWVKQVLRENRRLLPVGRVVREGLPKAFSPEIASAIAANFTYDPQTGDLFKNGIKVGSRRGGYIVVKVGGVNGRLLKAHRVAWFIHYGQEPSGQIDHVDGDGENNCLANLRLSDASTNAFNRRRPTSNSTGVKGVSQDAAGRYRATVGAFGRSVSVMAGSLEEAREARQRLAGQLHGEFVRHE